MSPVKRFNPTYKVYKPAKDWNRGTVSVWEYNMDTSSFFLSLAPQKPEKVNNNAVFNWDLKILMSLSIDDIGKLLDVFGGRINDIQLYHETKKANTILKVTASDRGVLLNMSKKDKLNGGVERINHGLAHSEVEVIKSILRQVVWGMYYNSNTVITDTQD